MNSSKFLPAGNTQLPWHHMSDWRSGCGSRGSCVV